MSKGGVTKKIEQAIEALDKGQVKKALFVLDTEKTARHHKIVADAARKCLSEKGSCPVNLKEARDKLKETITPPLDTMDLEGVEEMLEQKSREPKQEKTDEELYEECEECHVAMAASKFADVCDEHPEETGQACKVIYEKLEDGTVEPVDWIKTMVETTEQVKGEPKQKMAATLTELTDYLERRDSLLLKELEVT